MTKEKGKLKILGIWEDGGSRYHRVYLPLSNLHGQTLFIDGEECKLEITLIKKLRGQMFVSENEIKDFDILYYNWIMRNNPSILANWCNKHNVKIIMDIDDFWVYPHNHIQKHTENVPAVTINLVCANHVVCSTERLSKHVSNYNKEVTISNNILPYEEFQNK